MGMGGSSVWGHLVSVGGLGCGACFQRCLPGGPEPSPVQVTIFPSLGLRVWVWLDMDMPRVQMCSCRSGDTEASGSEQVADRRSVLGWSRWWGMG